MSNNAPDYQDNLVFPPEEKDKRILSLIEEINSLKEELANLKATLRNYNIIGD